MNYREAIQFLYDLQLFGAKFGLENTRKLAHLAGDPQERLRFIHVAGTNGKGSVCAMLESIYRHAGLRVGLYTSPHLVSFRERMQVNREPIAETEVERLVEQMRRLLEQFSREHHPTFFEVVTVIALRHFAEHHCDVMIWETGMGGRLDATNIVTPLAAVITNVQFDHQPWLGDTLGKIASEKAGIIKPQVPVITAVDQPEALEVVRMRAKELSAPLVQVGLGDSHVEALHLNLPGPHQQRNAMVALKTVEILQAQLPVSHAAIRQGLNSVSWPGRFQIIERAHQTIVLDGAHNPDGMRALQEGLRERYPHRKPACIFGALADKNIAEMCRILAEMAARVVLCPVRSKRAAPVQDTIELCGTCAPDLQVSPSAGMSEALSAMAAEPLVVIAGSLYLVGEAMEHLGISTLSAPGEHALNEWQRTGGG